MFELKKLSAEAVPAAREKWELYRLLNHPFLAESICRDILEVNPEDQEALVALCLTLCDQFGAEGGAGMTAVLDVVQQLESEYQRHYYAGIAYERMGFSRLRRGGPGAGQVAYDWLTKAMTQFEAAEEIRPPGNDDAILRWNTCARVINARSDVHPAYEDDVPAMLE